MKTTLDYKIVELLASNLDCLHSISDLAKKLGVAYSHTHLFVKQLVKEGVVAIQKVGNVSVCTLNLTAPMTLTYLGFIESRKANAWREKNLRSEKIYEKIIQMQDSIHAVLVKNNRIILLIPENITGVDYSTFKNRVTLTKSKLIKNQHYYKDATVIYGAEKFWSILASEKKR